MAALSAGTIRTEDNIAAKKRGSRVVSSGAQIYKGSLIYANSSNQAVVCSDLGAAGNFLGVAENDVLGDGTKTVDFTYGHTILIACESGVTYAYINKSVFAFTDNGVTEASTVGPCVGVLKDLESASLAWVEICGPALAANT